MTVSADFADDALRTPFAALAYNVHRDLCRSTSGTVIQGSDRLFNVVPFAAAGKCRLTVSDRIHAHSTFLWESANTANKSRWARFEETDASAQLDATTSAQRNDDHLKETPVTLWYDVEWEGCNLDVLLMHIPRTYDTVKLYHVIADSQDIGERFVATVERFNAEVKDAIWVFEKGQWDPDYLLYKAVKNSTFDNLVLASDIKRTIKADLDLFFRSRDFYARYDIAWKRGFLLAGPPGNGKSHLIKALINHIQAEHPEVTILYVKAFVARGLPDEYQISAVFKRARNRPSLLIFEDLDSLVSNDNRSFFLNEVDGLAANTGIVMLATTNHPEKLDSAIRDRPSRFDRTFAFDLPAAEERLRFISMWSENKDDELKVPDAVAREICADEVTGGFSFAYLKELMLASMITWMHSAADSNEDKLPFTDVLRKQAQLLREHIAKNKEVEAAAAAAKEAVSPEVKKNKTGCC
ncbi:hypothetical protein HDU87_000652 [Geranomyces variabilis]|uniref:AAA+ ATPase domain-containing protein n=1 Tax=Geranomyces variabilis TaxID=109894 RepID=A0AAD5TBX4_9FUNG|nr:hypothetical protein HDU87_000652 [Geranomyces variabilis]